MEVEVEGKVEVEVEGKVEVEVEGKVEVEVEGKVEVEVEGKVAGKDKVEVFVNGIPTTYEKMLETFYKLEREKENTCYYCEKLARLLGDCPEECDCKCK